MGGDSSSRKKGRSSRSVYSLGSFSSDASETSSLSDRSDTNRWSVPRSRPRTGGSSSSSRGNSRKLSGSDRNGSGGSGDGIRRLGSSFRVSLRPNRHRQQVLQNNNHNRNDDFLDSANTRLLRRLSILLALLTLAFMSLLVQTPHEDSYLGQFYNSYYDTVKQQSVSTEDLVAQGEMSSRVQGDDHLRPQEEGYSSMTGGDSVSKRQSFYEKILSKSSNSTTSPFGFLRGSFSPSTGNSSMLNGEDGKRTDWGPSLGAKRDPHVVGYVLSIFTCYKLNSRAVNQYGFHEPSNDQEFHDAAIMLQASIHENSKRNPASQSSYDYEMIALVHVSSESCQGGGMNRSSMLESLGYRVERVREPINKVDIRDKYLQNHAPRNNGGRAGMKEMIRLFAYKLIEYSIVVLVDTRVMLLKPPDGIYDVMLNGPQNHSWIEQNQDRVLVKDTFYANGTIARMTALPEQVDIMYARDYTTMNPDSWVTGVSLDFLPLRPDRDVFQKLINTYQRTEYDKKWGWDHRGYAGYAGSMMTKGLLTYFYNEVQPNRKLELNRCIYNNKCELPFVSGRAGKSDNCRDVKEHKAGPDEKPMPCTDCRIQMFDEIVVANFAICNVPWTCPYTEDKSKVPLLAPTIKICKQYHTKWFTLRKQLEEAYLAEEKRSTATGGFHPDVFQGYCLSGGPHGNGAYKHMDSLVHFPHGTQGESG